MFTDSKLCRQFTEVECLVCNVTRSTISWYHIAHAATCCKSTLRHRMSSHQRCRNTSTCHHTGDTHWAGNASQWWQNWDQVTGCHECRQSTSWTGLQLAFTSRPLTVVGLTPGHETAGLFLRYTRWLSSRYNLGLYRMGVFTIRPNTNRIQIVALNFEAISLSFIITIAIHHHCYLFRPSSIILIRH